MKLLSLSIQNFKGLRELAIPLAGKSMNIYGDNAAGKTSVFDAFIWLLFDKDSGGAKDFEIKPLDAGGNVRNHAAETVVAAVLEHNGQTVELRKLYREKWARKRGAAEAEFGGHETKYYIDQLEVKRAQYQAEIAGFCDEAVFRLVTNPRQFAALRWDERRKILFGISGNVSDEDVIASDPALAPLAAMMGRRSVDEYRAFCAQQRTRFNKQLAEIPIRISSIEQASDAEGIDEEIEKAKASKLQVALAPLEYELVQLQSGRFGVALELEGAQAAHSKLQAAIESDLNRQRQEQSGEASRLLGQLSDKLARAQEKQAAHTNLKNQQEFRLKDLQEKFEALRLEHVALKEAAWPGEDTCPCCGQVLPPEKVEAARKAWEEDVAANLARCKAEGRAAKAEMQDAQAKIEQENALLEKAVAFIADTQAKIDAARMALTEESCVIPSEEQNRQLRESEQLVERLEKQAADEAAGAEERKVKLSEEISAIRADIEAHEKRRAKAQAAEKARQMVADLQAEQKAVNIQLEAAEKGLWLCGKFTAAKVAMVEESINSKFQLARFKLFDTQINGAVVDCCEATYKGVPYDALNNAAKINIGLDIIQTLIRHYEFAAPVFVDNAESVTELYPLEAQVIRLVVSEQDKELRCEAC